MTEEVEVQAAPAEAPKKVMLDQFCRDMSLDKSIPPHLLSAFHHSERTAKPPRLHDEETAYRARYREFCDAPVK